MNTITCPECGKKFEISEALTSQIEEAVLLEEKTRHKKELEEAKTTAEVTARKRIAEEMEMKMKESENESAAVKESNRKLREELLETTRLIRSLKEKDELRELEMEKKLAIKEEKIKLEATEKAEKDQHIKLLEKDKQLADTLKELEDAKRKLTQGSQQQQGEVFELEFEQILKQQYPHDKISPVGKGIRGADIVQEVWDSNGNYVGKIIWELKNTKDWKNDFITKLKVNKRAATADEAVIISEVLPAHVSAAGFISGVWVTKRDFVLPLADSLRVKLIQLLMIKNSLRGKDVKMEALYNYLTGTEFKNRIEAIIEAFSNMQQEVEKEKRYFANKWARDEKNIRQVIDSTYGMHGDLKGILAAAVPQIAGIDGEIELEEGKKTKQASLLES